MPISVERFARLALFFERFHSYLSDFLGYERSTALNESIRRHKNLNELGDY